MRMKVFALLAVFAFGVFAMHGVAAADNVALNKTVTASGSYSLASGTSLGTIVDGNFVPETTQWQSNVWWNGLGTSFTINLNGTFVINSFTIQADDNDTYRVSYWDAGSSSWKTAWDVPSVRSWGLVTRDSGALGPSTTTQLLFQATGGDNSYGVSEIQAHGSAVPLPPAFFLLGPGLGGLAMMRRRFKK